MVKTSAAKTSAQAKLAVEEAVGEVETEGMPTAPGQVPDSQAPGHSVGGQGATGFAGGSQGTTSDGAPGYGFPIQPMPSPGGAKVLAVTNQKGGVGKTTTTVSLSACFAEMNLRTLIIDLDPQFNATTAVGVEARQLDTSIYNVLVSDIQIEDIIEPTAFKNLHVAPSGRNLANAEMGLMNMLSRERQLQQAIHQVRSEYDVIMIDCPPALGLLTVNAMTAATGVVVPIQAEYLALEGVEQLSHMIRQVRMSLNPVLELTAVIIGMYDARTKLSREVAEDVRRHFGEKVCEAYVPRAVRLSEAPSHGQPITVYDPDSRSTKVFRELAKEIIDGAS